MKEISQWAREYTHLFTGFNFSSADINGQDVQRGVVTTGGDKGTSNR